MNKDWKKQLDNWEEIARKKMAEEQEKTHLGNFLRIRYGEEKGNWEADKYECHDCSAVKGQIHLLGCDVEECPVCHKQLISCGHLVDGHLTESLPKISNYSINPIYINSAKKEYFVKFLKITSGNDNEQKYLIFHEKDRKEKLILYCDKVLVGETLKKAIERILISNFGIKNVFSIFVNPKEEYDTNKNGEKLPCAVVSLSVKYEDIKVGQSFPFTAEWVSHEELKKGFLCLEQQYNFQPSRLLNFFVLGK